jgi:hypothetical protein
MAPQRQEQADDVAMTCMWLVMFTVVTLKA